MSINNVAMQLDQVGGSTLSEVSATKVISDPQSLSVDTDVANEFNSTLLANIQHGVASLVNNANGINLKGISTKNIGEFSVLDHLTLQKKFEVLNVSSQVLGKLVSTSVKSLDALIHIQ